MKRYTSPCLSNSETGDATLAGIPASICRLGLLLLCLPMSVIAVNLDDFQWHNRLLFLVAPDSSTPAVAQARDNLQRRSEAVIDRDLLVIQLFLDGQSLVGDRPITVSEAAQLRLELGIDSDEQLLVLIGKDGGEKRRAPLLTDVQEIFTQIDAMPMRRNEIRERN
jgi:hypothetical protein